MVKLLAFFSSHLAWTLAVLALLVLVVVLALVILVRRRRVPPPEEETAAVAPPPAGAVVVDFRNAGSQLRLSAAFRRALSELRRHLGGGGSRYRLPWYLLLGEETAGKSRLFPESGLNLPLGLPEEPSPERGDGVTFWFFDRGVVLDVSGDFVLRADGRTANERGWRHFVSLLREHRPERPLDGVVVAIPCAELVGPPEEEGARLAAAAEKGAALSRKLRQAQESLRMNFPVYVLVTGCEKIVGFESYVTEIPEHLRGDLFGWSSPYAAETSYRPEWVDEAFSLLCAGLHRAQVEAFGDQPVLEDPDGVFCFPEEFRALNAPLRVYLNQVFRASAYHELLPWRGIYFCGQMPPAADHGAGLLRDPGAVGGAVFVRDAFERKIFPERDLARPGALALLQGGRRLRMLQAAVILLALVSTLGLWWAAHHLRERKAELRVFLLNTAQDLEEERDRRLRGAVEHAFLHDKVFHMFEGMSKVDADWFGSVFIPSSWFSPFNGELRQAMVQAYNEIILRTLSEELGRALDRILATQRPAAEVQIAPGDRFIAREPGTPEGPPTDAPPDLRPLDRTPEFARLNQYVSSLGTLETNVNVFNRLRNTESLEDLDAVVRYLFNRDLPKSFFKNSELYSGALADVEYKRFQPLEHRPRTTRQGAELSGVLFDGLFDRNPAMADLKRSAELADQVAAASWDPSVSDEVTLLVELRSRLRRAEQELTAPELAWMSGETLDLGPSWGQLVQAARATIFLGPDTAQSFQDDGERRFQEFRRALLGLQAQSVGPLLMREPKSKGLQLSPQAKLLLDALDGLSRQGFVAKAAAAGSPGQVTLPARGRVLWDTLALQQAAGLYKPYEEFIEKTLAPFPPDLRETLETSARDRLGARMLEGVVEAQQPAGEPDLSSSLMVEQALASEVASFQAASGPLNELMDRFGKLGLLASKEQVSAAVAAQGAQILADADRLLALQAPYTPKGKGFEWWNGGKRLAFEAWSAHDEADLAAYLAAQRGEVAEISSRYVEPVLQAVGGRPASRTLRTSMARWTAIAEQLHRYAGKEPGNSVSLLEDLILKDLTDIEPASCSRRITSRQLAEPTPDFFLERRSALRRQVWDRCVRLAGSQAAQGYQKLADFFNQRLAGRFPFAPAPGRLDPEAEPEDIRSFFQLYAAYAPLVRAVPEAERPLGAGEFVDRMGAVRAFFAPFLDDPAHPDAPSYDLAVRFRENRRAEKGGDRIIRWELASGDALAVHPDTQAPIPWTLGAPLRLELQWAKDSPVIPVESADLPGVHVQGRTAVLELRDRWSLLSLLRARDESAPAEPAAQVLRFQVATRPEADPKAAPEMARVYVRVSLRAPDKGDKKAKAADGAPAPAGDLDVPAFPASAPAWVPRSDAG